MLINIYYVLSLSGQRRFDLGECDGDRLRELRGGGSVRVLRPLYTPANKKQIKTNLLTNSKMHTKIPKSESLVSHNYYKFKFTTYRALVRVALMLSNNQLECDVNQFPFPNTILLHL